MYERLYGVRFLHNSVNQGLIASACSAWRAHEQNRRPMLFTGVCPSRILAGILAAAGFASGDAFGTSVLTGG